MICDKHYKDCGKAIYSNAHSIVYCGEKNFTGTGMQCEVKMREEAEQVRADETKARNTFIEAKRC